MRWSNLGQGWIARIRLCPIVKTDARLRPDASPHATINIETSGGCVPLIGQTYIVFSHRLLRGLIIGKIGQFGNSHFLIELGLVRVPMH